ncbi:MAG: phosphopentomutase [Candidatus Ancaeobacter aquaticus]|nr:phosphopentomutase [Candidatus Ancaeobacter aquaticus]
MIDKKTRIFLIILDSVGIGALPDAESYGDKGANTLYNIAKKTKGFSLPHLQKLGLGNITPSKHIKQTPRPIGSYGLMAEKSAGKDTSTGHWELCGVLTKKPFPTYPNGFPKEIINPFKEKIKTDILGNCAASGTEIIKDLGAEHVKTGYPIVYTSADSVFQIACHEEVVSVKKLYEICEIARSLLKGKHNVCRVIARPFTGKPGSFTRTERRKDFAIPPQGTTLLDLIAQKKGTTLGIGKISDIFCGRGITRSIHTSSNAHAIDEIMFSIQKKRYTLTFANLVDFDTAYGHRNNVEGYYKALRHFDRKLNNIMNSLKDNDILVITADHGCDPTHPGTDHTREYVPLLLYGRNIQQGIDIGTRTTFADCGQTLADILNVGKTKIGKSFKDMVVISR